MNSACIASINSVTERESCFMKKILVGIGIVLLFFIIPIESLNFTTREISINKAAYDETFPCIAHGNTVSQQFVPQYNYIKKLEICIREVKCDVSQGYLQFCILDAEKERVYEAEISLAEMPSPGWYTVFSDIELMAGKIYYLNIDAVDVLDEGPGLAFFTVINAECREEEGQELTYAGFNVENGKLKVSFEYIKPLDKFDYLAYYLFAIFIVVFGIAKVKGIRRGELGWEQHL